MGLDRPWGLQEVKAPRFQDSWHRKVVRLSPPCTSHLYPPGNNPGTHFWWRLSQSQGHSAAERIMSMKNSNETIGNQTHYLLACSAVPQPTAPQCNPVFTVNGFYAEGFRSSGMWHCVTGLGLLYVLDIVPSSSRAEGPLVLDPSALENLNPQEHCKCNINSGLLFKSSSVQAPSTLDFSSLDGRNKTNFQKVVKKLGQFTMP
jgi:hypothetical protein